jgi:hypothetical protein
MLARSALSPLQRTLALSQGIYDTVGELIRDDTPHTQKFCRGEAFVLGFMNQSRIYLHECFALSTAGKGEAFG